MEDYDLIFEMKQKMQSTEIDATLIFLKKVKLLHGWPSNSCCSVMLVLSVNFHGDSRGRNVQGPNHQYSVDCWTFNVSFKHTT